MAAFYSQPTTVPSNEFSTASYLTSVSSQAAVSSNEMSTLATNATMTASACHMTSLDPNVTGAGPGGSPTGASIASPIVMFLAGTHLVLNNNNNNNNNYNIYMAP